MAEIVNLNKLRKAKSQAEDESRAQAVHKTGRRPARRDAQSAVPLRAPYGGRNHTG